MTEINTKYYISEIPRIDPEVKTKWLEALRSGDYDQGKRLLKTPEGSFCCLGVYCDVAEVPETEADQWVSGIGGGPSRFMKVPVFGNKDRENSVLIPLDYGIRWHPDTVFDDNGLCGGNHFDDVYTGDETVFRINTQKYKEAEVPGLGRWPFGLPALNDTGFTFTQIADIIDYFL